MKIDTSSIEGFDSMSPEDKVNALLELELNDNTEEITKLKSALSKSNSENADYKKKMKEKMSEDERLKTEQEEKTKELEARVAEYEKKEKIASCSIELAKLGYKDDVLANASQALADGDLNSFFKMHTQFLDMRDKEIKSKALENMPNPSAGDPVKTKTAEEKEMEQLRKFAGLK